MSGISSAISTNSSSRIFFLSLGGSASDWVKEAAVWAGGQGPGADRLGIGWARGDSANSWLGPGVCSKNVGRVGTTDGVTPIMGVPAGGENGSMV